MAAVQTGEASQELDLEAPSAAALPSDSPEGRGELEAPEEPNERLEERPRALGSWLPWAPPVRTAPSSWSAWRWPEASGKMPIYVQRRFRMKTFGLLGLQQGLVFAIMVLFDLLAHRRKGFVTAQSVECQVLFYCLGLVNMMALTSLYSVRNWYPQNYCCLAAITMIAGVFWGLARSVAASTLHFQLMTVMTVTMFAAAAFSWVLTREKSLPCVVVMLSVGLGWLVGSVVLVGTARYMQADTRETCLAIGFSLLLVFLMLIDVLKLLITCRPDDFMKVIVFMNSALLVVVSIPFFMLLFCFLHGDTDIRNLEFLEEAPHHVPMPVA
eukprot:CAMPEP_0115072524 /NCGR_PEP_ID=MMETSP0227-20121206/14279_1 /TAXON_ID=89957 /ORGANISM="Polarella glacialis, Strain CCMP 1383" /LENGTH=325 /DNA_ID=CAMNT_0002459283 /DNA_START=36 /DNA_END=1009 /DNA_ORIENTATION=+